ncbi:MAG: hypothetical protein D3926_23250, partial [Desulfobacteraceae bacterium]
MENKKLKAMLKWQGLLWVVMWVFGTGDVFSQNLYFPHVASNSSWETQIGLCNTGPEPVTGVFTAYNDSGEVHSALEAVTLPGNGRVQLTVGEIFIGSENIAYIVFESDTEQVTGYTRFYVENHIRASVPAATEQGSETVYIPHLTTSDNWWTGIGIVNTNDRRVDLDVEFNEGTTASVSLQPGAQEAFSIQTLVGQADSSDLKSAVVHGASGILGLTLFGNKPGLDSH